MRKLKKDGIPKKSGGQRAGSGQPKQAPTSLINFRIKVAKKAALKAKYGKELNKMFAVWVDSLINEMSSNN